MSLVSFSFSWILERSCWVLRCDDYCCELGNLESPITPLEGQGHPDRINGDETHCGRYQSLAGILHYVSGEKVRNTGVHLSLLPDYGYNVASCLRYLPL